MCCYTDDWYVVDAQPLTASERLYPDSLRVERIPFVYPTLFLCLTPSGLESHVTLYVLPNLHIRRFEA